MKRDFIALIMELGFRSTWLILLVGLFVVTTTIGTLRDDRLDAAVGLAEGHPLLPRETFLDQ